MCSSADTGGGQKRAGAGTRLPQEVMAVRTLSGVALEGPGNSFPGQRVQVGGLNRDDQHGGVLWG